MNITKDDLKNKIDELIKKFMENFVEVRYDKYGNDYKSANPMAIKSWFFKIFEESFEENPIYTVEQKNMFFFVFQYIIKQLN